ncbi:iron-sulfur cluster assembly accessory protein [Buchnera aphidicola]|nr:iron-sulfur cluster assembly accessory protein [Buchnera aphidicola]
MKIKKKSILYTVINKEYNNVKIYITQKAIDQFFYLLQKNSLNIGIKLDIKKSGCSGFRYICKLIRNLSNNHHLIEFNLLHDKKINFFIPIKIIHIVNNIQIDFVQNGINFIFVFYNSNMKNFCGCGESFNFIK